MDELYSDPNIDIYGLWLVNITGRLYYLRTPVKVICIKNYKDFLEGITYYVEAIMSTYSGQIIYFIFSKPVPHSCFKIVSKTLP